MLTLDVARFFPSIDLDVLAELVARTVRQPEPRALLLRILAAGGDDGELSWFAGDDLWTPLARRRGLPLGNLPSQTMANLMLTPLDAALRGLPGVVGHVRYVDDLMVVGDSRTALRHARRIAELALAQLRLRLCPKKVGIHQADKPLRFLGYLVGPAQVRLPGAARQRFERRIAADLRASRAGQLPPEAWAPRVAAWQGHARHGMGAGALGRYLRHATRLDSQPAGGAASCAVARGTTTTRRICGPPTATTTNRRIATTTSVSVAPAPGAEPAGRSSPPEP